MISMKKNIRLANILDTQDVVDLLNKVTIDLHEMGVNQWSYPWKYDEILSEISGRNVYLLICNDLIVGTFSLKKIGQQEHIATNVDDMYLYRIAILPEKQGKGLGREIVAFACDYARKISCDLYLDCWAGNDKLHSFYSNAGFIHLGNLPEEDYLISMFKYKYQ